MTRAVQKLQAAATTIDTLGPLLRAARESVGLTQRQLAERIGAPQSTVGRWETGVIAIKPNRLPDLFRALH